MCRADGFVRARVSRLTYFGWGGALVSHGPSGALLCIGTVFCCPLASLLRTQREAGTPWSFKQINLDGQPVYLLTTFFPSAEIREQYLLEEAVSTLTIMPELGDGSCSGACVGRVGPWNSWRLYWPTLDSTESNVKPSTYHSVWPIGGAQRMFVEWIFVCEMYPQNGIRLPLTCIVLPHAPFVKYWWAGLFYVNRFSLSLTSHIWLFHVAFHSVFQPHAGFLWCEDWKQRCWQNRHWPLWESCAQDCGKLHRLGNRRGMSQLYFLCAQTGSAFSKQR